MEKDPRIIDADPLSSSSSLTSFKTKDESPPPEQQSQPQPSSLPIPIPNLDMINPIHTAANPQSSPSKSPLTPSPTSAQDIPLDGGLQAWLQVLGSTIILILTWGLINTFGVYQSYYERVALPGVSPSQISWIGSVQASLLMLVGVISGPLFDAGYFRHLLYTGLFLVVFGQFMTSLCETYWEFLLAQGFCIGIGMGLLFLPSAAIVSQYFTKNRALAIGIASAGSPVAGIVFPIIFSKLEPSVGFGWATRVIAFILLGLSVIPLVFMRARVPVSGHKRALFDPTAVRDVPLMLFCVGGFFAFLTLYVPFFYITVFATSHDFSSAEFAPYLVTLLNAGSVFGRIVPNAMADRWGSLNVIVICTFVSSVLAFAWMGIRNQAGSIVFALLYGAFSGGLVSLSPSVLMGLTTDMRLLGTRMGMNFLVLGVSILIGTPIAGAILGDFTEAEWLGMMGYGAAGLFLASIFWLVARLVLYRSNGKMKA